MVEFTGFLNNKFRVKAVAGENLVCLFNCIGCFLEGRVGMTCYAIALSCWSVR